MSSAALQFEKTFGASLHRTFRSFSSTTMNLNAPTSHFPVHQVKEDHDLQKHYHTFAQNQRIILSSSSSSSASSYAIRLNPAIEDHQRYCDRQIRETLNHEAALAAGYAGGVVSPCNKVTSGFKFTLCKQPHQREKENDQWMKKRSGTKEDHKMQSSSDLSSNTSPSKYNNPVRVCTDCNTTKTPLWRSGPKGPKSLCNACGIRQRKARRAMAAVTSGDTTATASYHPPGIKIKLQYKENIGKDGHSSRLKKRCKMVAAVAANTTGSASSAGRSKKLNLEDFHISLSQSLSFHRVFPEDEKDAAILLMAISSGLVHG